MAINTRQDSRWLLKIARQLAVELKLRVRGTAIRVRLPSQVTVTNTAGWSATIGKLGKQATHLEIRLDRFSGHKERKLWVCFRSNQGPKILNLTKRVNKKLAPIRTITSNDIDDAPAVSLAKRLPFAQFNQPILEKYGDGNYFGIYDRTSTTATKISPHFLALAASFFESVARTLPGASAEDESQEVYPQLENRRVVVSHLRRERSRLLATECKIRDNYQCQVCGLRFEKTYGRLGQAFAEAHHIVQLAKLRENIKTRQEDLATVCANCHRMLHRMNGKPGDINSLKTIIRKQRGIRT